MTLYDFSGILIVIFTLPFPSSIFISLSPPNWSPLFSPISSFGILLFHSLLLLQYPNILIVWITNSSLVGFKTCTKGKSYQEPCQLLKTRDVMDRGGNPQPPLY